MDWLQRREFITLLGGAAAWPLAAGAQQSEGMRRIGVLGGFAENDPEMKARLAGFRQGLERLGWSEGRNVRIHYRFAPAGTGQEQALAKELVALQPDVIIAHSTPVAAALKGASQIIPIVFVSVSDPIGSGFVASLARPGGNLTGLLLYEDGITGKWLAMLKEIAPRIERAALVANPKTTNHDYFLRSAKAVAPSLAIELVPSPIENAADLERVIESFARVANGGLVVLPDNTAITHRDLDHRARCPAPFAGGLQRPLICRGRRSHVLRYRPRRHVSAGGVLCRQHPARRQACRPTGAGADQVRNYAST